MRIVLALGGNALGNSPEEQYELVKISAENIVDLIEEGHEVVIVHGNGPQVGMIVNAFEALNEIDLDSPKLPLAESNAMSQGYIGYHLQNRLREALLERNINKGVVSLVTQVTIDPKDEAFNNPTKPIGTFYTKAEVEELKKRTSYEYVEDSGRGYRRVVASPRPMEIVEVDTIETLLENEKVVIALGGGGIPVYSKSNLLLGVDAVIDKDLASSKLAEQINAEMLIILTAVEKVAINFGKPNEEWLDELNIERLDEYIKEGHFAPGSMLPKIEAAKEFVLSGKDRKALITSLKKAAEGIKGKTGTTIKN